jgi:alpha-ketoglutarate-dependent taurine dioxygenase
MGQAIDQIAVIEGFEAGQDTLLVWLAGRASESPLELPWYWVRDHSEDPSALDAETHQRSVDSFSIDRSLRPTDVEMVDGRITVTWPDDTPSSILGPALLAELDPQPSGPTLWHTGHDVDLPSLGATEVLDSDAGLGRWLDAIATWGLGLVEGCGTGIDDAEALANRIGYVRRTVFGAMWTLSSEVVAHDDSAYGNETLLPHTDGSYSHDGPGLQFFVCSERTGTGGESVLVDGFAAAKALAADNPSAFEILTEVAVPAHYIESGIHLRASRPTIRLDDRGEVIQVTLNNYDRAPFLLAPDRMAAWYDAYGALHRLVADESTWWTRKLEPGDALIFDNWRCLHGRMAYSGRRIFHGGYINHEDFESRLRTVGGAR